MEDEYHTYAYLYGVNSNFLSATSHVGNYCFLYFFITGDSVAYIILVDFFLQVLLISVAFHAAFFSQSLSLWS